MSEETKARQPKLEEYKRVDGTYNWDALHAAEAAYKRQRVADGTLCSRCGRYANLLSSDVPGYERLCYDCKNLRDDADEVSSDNDVRCPECGHIQEAVADCDDSDRYAEGEHSVTCSECEHEYTIETQVSYSFTSPARATGAEGGE